MFDFNGIKIKTNSNREKKLQDILDNSDHIKIINEKINSYTDYGSREYNVMAYKGSFSIWFSLHIDSENRLTDVIADLSHNAPVTSLNFIAERLYLSYNKDFKEKLDIIRCKDKRCPICNSKMNIATYFEFNDELACNNRCFYTLLSKTHLTNFTCKIFNDKKSDKSLSLTLKERIEMIDEIYNKILYWKEEDRYLMKIMKG
ncbi:gp460 [Bacillus phage G]|uniref:Gp460 n=1 Tax=Bacillus phage G TaxID=2884420 RepID=G3MAK1_9CAUD|nr:gp460 [Bacillus phage G]AEO93718.1 gp460 [Bacillus phage G]